MEVLNQMRPIMRCKICSKSFDNRKQYLRHSSYCRKAKTRVTSRKKSCTACTKAKTRCDLTYPKCSRCVARAFTCGYDWVLPSNSALIHLETAADQPVASDLTTTAALNSPQSTRLVSPRTDHHILNDHSAVTGSGQTLADSYNDGRWDLAPVNSSPMYAENLAIQYANTSEMTFSNSLGCFDPETIHSDAFQFSFSPSHMEEYSHPLSLTIPRNETRLPRSFSTTTFLNPRTHPLQLEHIIAKAPKAFNIRKIPNHQRSINRSFVLCGIRSYTNMMLPGTQLPPFIHPFYGHADTSGNKATQRSGQGPLEICAAIVQMYSVKNDNNTIFIWKAIRMEQERLDAEVSEYNDRDTVAALQAVTVYFLLRVSEDDEDATNFDVPLIYTMIKISIKLNGVILKNDNYFESTMPTWENWILAESLRRTIIVQVLIDLLFHVSSALPLYTCDGSNLVNIALPCGRDLWRASTRAEWEKAYTTQRDKAAGEKQLTYRDLMNFHLRPEGMFDNWLSQVDDFGMLVMAAASLQHWSDVPRV